MSKRLEVKSKGIFAILEKIVILIFIISLVLVVPYKTSQNHMIMVVLTISIIISFVLLVVLSQFVYHYKLYTKNGCLFVEDGCFIISETYYYQVGGNIVLYEGYKSRVLRKDEDLMKFLNELGISEKEN